MKNSYLLSFPKSFFDEKHGAVLNGEEWAALGRLLQRLFEKENPRILPIILNETLLNLDPEELDLEDEWWEAAPEGVTPPAFEINSESISIFHSRVEMNTLAGKDIKDEEWMALVVALNDLYVSFFVMPGDGVNGIMWGIQGEINGIPEALS